MSRNGPKRKVTCELCGSEISVCNISKHLRRHEKHPETFKEKEIHKLDHNDLICKFCNKECKSKNSLIQHEIRCKENPDRQYSNTLSNQGWAKGLTKETDDRIKRCSIEKTKTFAINGGTFKGRHHSEETKQHLSEVMTEYNHENKHRNLHSKGGYYNGIYFMSTWELAYYIYQIDLGAHVIRCVDRFEYFYKNK